MGIEILVVLSWMKWGGRFGYVGDLGWPNREAWVVARPGKEKENGGWRSREKESGVRAVTIETRGDGGDAVEVLELPGKSLGDEAWLVDGNKEIDGIRGEGLGMEALDPPIASQHLNQVEAWRD